MSRVLPSHLFGDKEIIDLFIFETPNSKFGAGKYSMYIVTSDGIMLYEGIDKPIE